jgi:hypothetical protein
MISSVLKQNRFTFLGGVILNRIRSTAQNRVFAATGLRPFAQMASVTAAAGAPAAPTGPGGPDDHLANTTNVIRYVAAELTNLRFILFIGNPSFSAI